MKSTPNLKEYATARHALEYLTRLDRITHRAEGEAVLAEIARQGAAGILERQIRRRYFVSGPGR